MTPEEIEALAFKPSSFIRGTKLANPSKWNLLGINEEIIWGICKGSRGSLYEVRADVGNIGYKCSCISREFPCKHVIGLLLLHAQNQQAFTEKETEDWVKDWLGKRRKSAAKKVKTEPDSEEALIKKQKGQKKTVEKRKEQMRLGVIELKNWLEDVIRLGLAELKKEPYSYFEEKGARFQDAKLSTVRNSLIELHSQLQQKDWQIQSLQTLAWLYTLANSYERIETFPDTFQIDLRTALGVEIKKTDLIEKETAVQDNWLVLGKIKEVSIIDSRLKIQRTWLLGEQTQQFALLLDFSYAGAAFDYYFSPATAFHGELVYYPATYLIRATLKTKYQKLESISQFKTVSSFSDFLQNYSKALALNPFILQFPFLVSNLYFNSKMEVFDEEKKQIPLSRSFKNNYELLALSGGLPIALFGEWTGEKLIPLAALIEGKIYEL